MKNRIFRLMLLVLFFIAVPLFLSTGCSDTKVSGKQVYYCPMHPQVQSDKPGVCPICHMDLVLRGSDSQDMAENNKGLEFNDREIALANVNTVKVQTEELTKEINSFSYLDFAEENRKIITARFSGRIEKLFVNKTGVYVKKGEPLFEIYSPDLIQAQTDYLLTVKNFGDISMTDDPGKKDNILHAAKKKLLFLGITEAQIKELENSGQVNYSIPYHSPFNGTVIEKKVQEGMYVNEGTLIYDIADLSTLWSISEIFSDDLGLIKPGSRVKLNLQAYPGKIFEGRVDLIYPVVSSESRTVKVRSVFNNSGGLLKPNMYGETVFSVYLGTGLVIPSEAIIFTGKQGMVWVESEPGKFQMKIIKTGYRLDGKYQVLSGLKEGEKVAAEGSYLIDSESQLSGTHEAHTGENIQGQNIKNNSHIEKVNSIFNEVCPVLGNKIPEDAVTVNYNGKKIGFCCPGCDEKFNSDPESYMKNLSLDGKKFTKKS